MSDTENIFGGFAAVNTGKIKNCYSYLAGYGRRNRLPFVAKDSGSIFLSFTNDKGAQKELRNNEGTLSGRMIRAEKDATALGFDTDNIWEFEKGRYFLRFNEKKWKTAGPSTTRKPLCIKDKKGLLKFIELINSGDKRAISAYVKLENDIDLGNAAINPIGNTRQNAFSGVFDGNCHTIGNFRIKGKSIGNYGLFGYLKGAVINLTTDCNIKGEGKIGGFCAVNEGVISCCGAISSLSGNGEKLYIGGFVAKNSGTIERCYSATKITVLPIPLIPIGLISSSLILLGTIAFLAIPPMSDTSGVYAPIPTDSNVIKIVKEEEPPPTDAPNRVSFQFNETLHIDPDNGRCYLNFENPSYSSNKIVIKLMSDDDDSIMAESGGIEPGYGLKYIPLNDNGYDKVNSGATSGHIVINAYDCDTNDKAMIDSTLPVTLVID